MITFKDEFYHKGFARTLDYNGHKLTILKFCHSNTINIRAIDYMGSVESVIIYGKKQIRNLADALEDLLEE